MWGTKLWRTETAMLAGWLAASGIYIFRAMMPEYTCRVAAG